MYTKFWSEYLRDHAGGVYGKIELERIVGKGGRVWIGCNWLRIGTSGGIL
jgi:hypothetical protein